MKKGYGEEFNPSDLIDMNEIENSDDEILNKFKLNKPDGPT